MSHYKPGYVQGRNPVAFAYSAAREALRNYRKWATVICTLAPQGKVRRGAKRTYKIALTALWEASFSANYWREQARWWRGQEYYQRMVK